VIYVPACGDALPHDGEAWDWQNEKRYAKFGHWWRLVSAPSLQELIPQPNAQQIQLPLVHEARDGSPGRRAVRSRRNPRLDTQHKQDPRP